MQDFDTLRHRVEETAERLSLAQSERQKETQSLIGILRDLEEKYSAQERQFAYYRARLEPLERSNAQLTSLIENLLDLIDTGFGEGSLDPLRKASTMASAMLGTDLATADDPRNDEDSVAGEASADGAIAEMDTIAPEDIEPEMATIDDADETYIIVSDDGEPEMATIDDVDEAFDDTDAVAAEAEPEMATFDDMEDEDTVAVDDGFDDEPEEARFGEVTDLELEEVALANLEDDIEAASDYVATDLDAVAALDLAAPASATAVAGDDVISPADMVLGDDVLASADTPADTWDATARFEDVSDAVLELEREENAGAGYDDLPAIVKTAAAAFASDDATDEVDAIAALAEAMEKETSAARAKPPAPSDIRSLMLRVEALAKKAEAMRLAQIEDETANQAADRRQTSAKGDKDPGVAA